MAKKFDLAELMGAAKADAQASQRGALARGMGLSPKATGGERGR